MRAISVVLVHVHVVLMVVIRIGLVGVVYCVLLLEGLELGFVAEKKADSQNLPRRRRALKGLRQLRLQAQCLSHCQ